MSHLPYTSQEVNKSWGKGSNKFYRGRWEVRVNGFCAGKQICDLLCYFFAFHLFSCSLK